MSIPNSVTSLGSGAFNYCKSLEKVTIPDSITVIEVATFYYCTALKTVTISEGLTEIKSQAFEECYSLKSITIPDSVTSIGYYAFHNCKSLTSITIPDNVPSIGISTFEGCKSLTSVTIGEGVTNINSAAFKNCKALTSVSIPASVNAIQEKAFEGCESLTSVTLHDKMREIGAAAFKDCKALTSVRIPAKVRTIGDKAFGYYTLDGNDMKVDGFTIYGKEKSVAQTYAEKNGFQFVALRDNPFVDVQEDDFFFNPVMWALDNSVTGGIDETHFAPAQTVMRADAMVFFWAANQRPAFTDSSKTFKDVKKKHWAYNAVMWAVENGITGGTDAAGNYFSPKQTCSRSEILQFLYAAMGKPEYTIENPYSDVKTKHWYYDGAIWAYEKGLEKGENGKFQAKTPCTRGYVVTYLYRYMTGLELAE